MRKITTTNTKVFFILLINTILNKIVGFLKEMLVLYFFSNSLLLNVYLTITSSVDFFYQIFGQISSQANVIFKYTEYSKSGKNDTWSFIEQNYSKLYWFIGGIGILTTFITVYLTAKGDYLFWFSISILATLTLITSLINGIRLNILQAQHKYKIFAFYSVTSYVLVIVGILLFQGLFRFGIYAMIIARILGELAILYKIDTHTIQKDKKEENKSFKELGIYGYLCGNLTVLLITTSRWLWGISNEGNIQLMFFYWSTVFLNLFNSLITNVLVPIIIKNNIEKENTAKYTLLYIIIIFIGYFFVHFNISWCINTIFGFSRQIKPNTLEQIISITKAILPAFFLQNIYTIIIQPILMDKSDAIRKNIFVISFILSVFITGGYYLFVGGKNLVYVFIYSNSVFFLIGAIIGIIKRFKNSI